MAKITLTHDYYRWITLQAALLLMVSMLIALTIQNHQVKRSLTRLFITR
jgi:hypothetical protein